MVRLRGGCKHSPIEFHNVDGVLAGLERVRKLVGDPLAMFRLAARYASALEGANGNVAAAVVHVDRSQARRGHRVAGRDPHGKNHGFASVGNRVQHRDCAEIVDVGVNVGVEDDEESVPIRLVNAGSRIVAMVIARILEPVSKLATTRAASHA